MRLMFGLATAILVIALPSFAAEPKAKAGCPDGKVKVRGECFDPCPTAGRFAQPTACECPPGFGKLLFGDGGGECQRLACATGAEFDTKSPCECPNGLEKKTVRKGKARCVVRTAKAK